MNNRFAASLCVAACLIFFGCSSQESVYSGKDVSRYVDPTGFGSAVSGEAPSIHLPAKKAEAEAVASDTIFTKDMKWEIKDGYFSGEDFSFFIPLEWRKSFSLESVETKQFNGFEIRIFNFGYFEAESGLTATLLKIEVDPDGFVQNYGIYGKKELGISSDGGYHYLSVPVPTSLPDGFSSTENYIDILGELVDESYTVSITA